MFGFDKMFDFNRDRKLDSLERAAQFQFMDKMMKEDEKSIFDDDDEIDIFVDTGPNYNERKIMVPDGGRMLRESGAMIAGLFFVLASVSSFCSRNSIILH